ncbi:MAG: hypothetical protein M1608_08670, partial [Candidatus Omnitrophica bacterium]|nr:hypothetical protein [Candidatus Omnitrophota bacterium]
AMAAEVPGADTLCFLCMAPCVLFIALLLRGGITAHESEALGNFQYRGSPVDLDQCFHIGVAYLAG